MHADRRVVLSLVLSSAFHSGTAVWRLRYRPSAISRVLARRNAGVVIFHFKPTADCNWSKMHLDVGRSGRGAAGSTRFTDCSSLHYSYQGTLRMGILLIYLGLDGGHQKKSQKES